MGTQLVTAKDNPFTSDPVAGALFAGRAQQLARLRLYLGAIQGQPQHMCVVGRRGEGKTSFLKKAIEEASTGELIACKCNLDASRSAEEDIQIIFEALLDAIDKATGQDLTKNWQQGKNSTYRTAQHLDQVRTDDLLRDFESLRGSVQAAGRYRGCLVCVDDAQSMHPVTLKSLRNALQNVGVGYMLIVALRNDSLDASNAEEGPRIIQDIANRAEDTGAPRLFGNNYALLGPFDSQAEADDCIRKRLDGRPIQFTPGVIGDLGRVSGRYPKVMMDLANELYTLAQLSDPPVQIADNVLFTQAFTRIYQGQVKEAVQFVGQETNTKRTVFLAAMEFDAAFTALQIARKILAGVTTLKDDEFAVDPVSIALDRLVATKYCSKKGTDQYQWTEPLRTHSLRLALG